MNRSEGPKGGLIEVNYSDALRPFDGPGTGGSVVPVDQDGAQPMMEVRCQGINLQESQNSGVFYLRRSLLSEVPHFGYDRNREGPQGSPNSTRPRYVTRFVRIEGGSYLRENDLRGKCLNDLERGLKIRVCFRHVDSVLDKSTPFKLSIP